MTMTTDSSTATLVTPSTTAPPLMDESPLTVACATAPAAGAAPAVNQPNPTDAQVLRARHWAEHPIVTAGATLPTTANLRVLAMIQRAGAKSRKPITFWAHPQYGKSSTLRAARAHVRHVFPGCGVFNYQVTPKDPKDVIRRTREVRELEFLSDLLIAANLEGRQEPTPSRRRMQLQRALLALSLPARHLFMFFDEAQEFSKDEYCWLKSITNWLADNGVRLSIVSFGQVEILEQREKIVSEYRSDLHKRFIGNVYELQGITDAQDMVVPLAACDDGSEFPAGSGLSYTRFLLPLAYANNLRFAALAPAMWAAFLRASPLRRGESSIALEHFADALSELAELLRERDAPDLVISDEDLDAAIAATNFAIREEVRAHPDARP
jgi:hypothetical protein